MNNYLEGIGGEAGSVIVAPTRQADTRFCPVTATALGLPDWIEFMYGQVMGTSSNSHDYASLFKLYNALS